MDRKPAPNPEGLPDALTTERDEGESFAGIVARHQAAEQVAEQHERDKDRADWRAKHGPESFGPFVLYPPDGIRTGWIITYRNSAVPGMYADRDTARFVCGYVLGGEQYGPVGDAWDYRAREHGRDTVPEDVFWLQEDSEESDRLGIEPQGTPPNLAKLEPVVYDSGLLVIPEEFHLGDSLSPDTDTVMKVVRAAYEDGSDPRKPT